MILQSFQIVDGLSLNPGLGETFPWLAQVAMNYEEYEFLQLVITFKSTIDQSLATNGQSGQVALTTSYNPSQDPFGSKQEMMGYSGGMSCKTNQSMIHGVECDPAKNSGSAGKFVRPGYVATQDLKNFDLGTTFVSILDCPSQFLGQTLGELWVSYTVTLRKPKLAVHENYNVGRICATALNGTFDQPFGLQNDQKLLVSTKGTIPVTFVRPLAGESIPQNSLITPSPPLDILDQSVPSLYGSANWPYLQGLAHNISVVFPPYYSGIVEIVLRERYLMGNVPALFWPSAFGQGQIYRYKDMPTDPQNWSAVTPAFNSAANQDAWTHVDNCVIVPRSEGQTGFSPNMNSNGNMYKLRIRVLPANNGIENRVWFGSRTTTTFERAYIEVTGHNTYLSLDDARIPEAKARLPLEIADQPSTVAYYP